MAIPSRRSGWGGGCVITSTRQQGNGAPSFLIVSLRYIGDVLLSTPLALSIKEQIPDAAVDYLVFKGAEGILAKNPHVRTVHTLQPGSRNLGLLVRLWRGYDVAIGTNPSDRTCIFAAIAGKRSCGFFYNRPNEWWKKKLLGDCRLYDHRNHIVPLILTQLEPFGILPRPRVVMGFDDGDRAFARAHLGKGDYVILHPYARKGYKYWPPAAWGRLAELIGGETGLRPVFTVSPAPADRAVLDAILAGAPVGTTVFHEPYTLCRLAAAIRGGRGYVGVDTVATHMAAALDVPTVALFGPTMVRHWGPWPNGSPEKAPYQAKGCVQRVGGVTVVQKEWPCVPCNRESCEISERGGIECMAAISPEEVLGELCRVIGLSPNISKLEE